MRRGAATSPTCPTIPRFANDVERVEQPRAAPTTSSATVFAHDDPRRVCCSASSDADIAFAEVNTMADLAAHPHLRRIEVETPNGSGRAIRRRPPIVVGESSALRRGARHRRRTDTQQLNCAEPLIMTDAKLDLDHLRQWIGRTERGHRHRHRAARQGPARDPVPWRSASRKPATPRRSPCIGAWRSRCIRCRARARRPPDPRRLPAAGAAAAADVGRRRAGISRAAAGRRRGDADLAHRRRDDEERLDRARCASSPSSTDHHAARHRDPRAPGHRLSRHAAARSGAPRPSAAAAAGGAASRDPHRPIRCCCSATRR